jgi:deoxycytidylate deaminase
MQQSLLPRDESEKRGARFVLDYPEGELVVGLVHAVGTDYRPVLEYLLDTIKLSGYAVKAYHVSDWFKEIAERAKLTVESTDGTEYQRIASLIDAGNKIREWSDRADIVALIAASKLFTTRETDAEENPIVHKRTAHVIVSMKRPEEIETLRKIYGPGFFLIGIFADESERLSFLMNRKGLPEEQAQELINRDQKEKDVLYGQRTRDTFQMSDVFVGLANKQYEKGLLRFLKLVFGDPFSTPTRDEHSMFLAYAASLRSGDLARQVGAALACSDGDVISLGCNDVPAPGGGLYCADHGDADERDHVRKKDSNDVRKQTIIDEMILTLRKKFLPDMTDEQILLEARPLFAESMVGDLTEFGRAVHAEMDALMAAGRIGVSFRDATLYTTTFPCHNCTRHIITAGIKRVVYIEPYPKSLAMELHEDAIRIGADEGKVDRIPFEPFLGIGPRRFFDLFSLKLSSGYTVERKKNGKMVDWDFRRNAKPRVPMPPTSYLEREQLITKTLNEIFPQDEGLKDVERKGVASQERPRLLEGVGEDREASPKLARMEDRRTRDNPASGEQSPR